MLALSPKGVRGERTLQNPLDFLGFLDADYRSGAQERTAHP